GWTPLHSAVCGRHYEAVKLLLKLGADLSAVAGSGDTLLHIAASACDPAIVNVLLDHGANVSDTNYLGETPMHSREMATWRIIALSNVGNWEVSKMLMESGGTVNERGFKGKTVLHMAVEKRQYDLVDSLVRLGADWDVRDNTGRSPRDYMQHLSGISQGE
ncbi:ankyrin, partial [Phaeosphaeriaceae sp. SRC1lsM3a]